MHLNMFRRVSLTENVGTLEMMKRNFDFSSGRRGNRRAQLGLVRISEQAVHGAAWLRLSDSLRAYTSRTISVSDGIWSV
jgi:hypothetical protein